MKTYEVTTKQREYRIVDVIRVYTIEAEDEAAATEWVHSHSGENQKEWDSEWGTDGEDEEEVTDTEDVTPSRYCYVCEESYQEDEFDDHECKGSAE